MNNGEILNQIRSEYEEGRSYLEPRKTRWTRQLMMMNNLQRGEGNIASTTLYSFFNRVFGALYSNTMSVKFVPGNDAELYATASLNKLAVSDSQEMDKPMLDFDWLWDACFYGVGYVETLKWNKKRKLMEPEVVNPMFFSYDPYFSNHQEWRYYDKWKLMNKHDIERLIKEEKMEAGVRIEDIETGVDPYIWTWHIQAELAKDVNPAPTDSIVPSSGIYQILEHAMYIDGDKYIVQTNRSITEVLRKVKLELEDDPDHEGESLWPLVKKQVFREPHSSATVSVPDLIEDKHRALNVLFNLAYIAVKDEVNPLYLYDTTKVQNPSQFFQRQPNQHIAVSSVDGAIAPMKQKPSLSSSALAFINTMKSEASDAIGTAMPATMGQKKKSATQDAILQQIADLTQSLQAKLIQNGEMDFWSHWYQRYLKHTEAGDIKMSVTSDALGSTFEMIELDKIKTKYPPRICILASKEAEYKEMTERRELAGQLKLVQGVLSPSSFRIFLKEIYFPKFKTFDQSSIDVVMPKSSSEIQAEHENEVLSDGEWAEVKETDDHEVHLALHMRAKKNDMTWTHILTHQVALAQKKDAEAKQQQENPGDQGGDAKPKPEEGDTSKEAAQTKAQAKTKPTEAAVPTAGQKSPLQPNPLPSN